MEDEDSNGEAGDIEIAPRRLKAHERLDVLGTCIILMDGKRTDWLS